MASRAYAAAALVVLGLAYVVPYAVLANAGGWILYTYWVILGVVAAAIAWLGTRGWERGR